MQFHHNGYVSGDPRVLPAAGAGLDRPGELPDEMDVLIVGTGPAGIVTAAQLSMYPSVTTRIIDRRPGRLEIGQADGIQARSVETFQAFGFAERIIAEAYRITEMAFWKPDPLDPSRIVRAAVTVDDEHGISEFPHLLVNQARVLDYFTEFMAHAPTRMKPDFGYEFRGLEVGEGGYPVRVALVRTAGERIGEERIVRAKYVAGADGARSAVREAIGAQHIGAQAFHAWGVMDALAVTDFPDIRTKCSIQSEAGNILLIPREGGFLFRMYVDLGAVPPDDHGAVRKTTLDEVIAKANDILRPYRLDVKDVPWHSVYEVGHRLTERFDDVPLDQAGTRAPRVFIAGDACHTHSAKAGQGMNVSMQDGWNLGWKLGQVASGRSPESLLATYSAERQEIAQNLIDFDREWSTLMARKPEEFESPSALEDFYVSTAEFPAGFMTQYKPSMIVGGDAHQALASGFPIGKRFKSARVARVADGNDVHLGHHHRADGRWRVYAFADGGPDESPALANWAQWLANSAESPLTAYTSADADPDSVLELKVVYPRLHGDIDLGRVPGLFLPHVGAFGLVDYEKVYGVLADEDIFALRDIDPAGSVVVVRPDQYVAHVLPLTATDELAAFFGQFLRAEPVAAPAS